MSFGQHRLLTQCGTYATLTGFKGTLTDNDIRHIMRVEKVCLKKYKGCLSRLHKLSNTRYHATCKKPDA